MTRKIFLLENKKKIVYVRAEYTFCMCVAIKKVFKVCKRYYYGHLSKKTKNFNAFYVHKKTLISTSFFLKLLNYHLLLLPLFLSIHFGWWIVTSLGTWSPGSLDLSVFVAVLSAVISWMVVDGGRLDLLFLYSVKSVRIVLSRHHLSVWHRVAILVPIVRSLWFSMMHIVAENNELKIQFLIVTVWHIIATYSFICTNTARTWRWEWWFTDTYVLTANVTSLNDILAPCIEINLWHWMTWNSWIPRENGK